MNNTTHTPGPLRIEGTHLVDDIAEEPLPHAVIRDSTERWVALVEITDDEGLGNAHLIAAAPAMYEALRQAYAYLAEMGCDCEEGKSCGDCIVCQCETALAQAEGKP